DNLWDVIVNGDLEEESTPTRETYAPPAPKTMLNHSGKQSNQGLEVMKNLRRCRKIQLEVHGAPISKEDINQKFLRSLLPLWNQIALIMRNKPYIDEIDIDDLYNNLRVYKDEMKRSSSSTSTSQKLAFLSSESTSSTNEVSTASGDFGQIDQDDLEELDLRWQVAMLTVRGILLENADLEGIKGKDLMVTMAGAMHQQMNLHHISSSSSDNEVQKCSKQYLEYFKTLQKNYDSEREKHSRTRLEIQGYELALESLESKILVHEKNELT
ncbi:hypothetical protein Tco_1536050, partial [Tanacetum coccineum]